jgi:hypothetical protein
VLRRVHEHLTSGCDRAAGGVCRELFGRPVETNRNAHELSSHVRPASSGHLPYRRQYEVASHHQSCRLSAHSPDFGLSAIEGMALARLTAKALVVLRFDLIATPGKAPG